MRLNISIQQYDKPLLMVCLFLCAFGTIMLYSASWNESFIRSGGSTESMYLKAHLMRVLIGFVFMFIFSKGIEVLNSTNSYDIEYDGPDKTPAEKWLPFTKKKD